MTSNANCSRLRASVIEETTMNNFGISRTGQTVLFGWGQRHALPRLIKPFGNRAFICTDNRFPQDSLLCALATGMRSEGIAVEVYDATVAELPLECILDAASQARAFGPAVVVGIGGGSCMDLAKLVALALSHSGEMSAFYGEFKVPAPVLPVIAIPTTAGTGSEVTPVAVLADPARDMKVGISSPYLIPQVAVCDPELTMSCPPRLTAIAGADAMTHAIESFTAVRREPTAELGLNQVFVGKNVFADAHALLAINALASNLATAVKSPDDRSAREQVMLGALAAGIAFGTAGTAAAHAIQYPVGAVTHTAHGLGVATLMPYVMEFNLPACLPEYSEIAHIFGVAQTGHSNEQQARRGIDAVQALFNQIGVPESLAALGLAEDKLEWVGEQSMLAARLVNNNPRQLSRESINKIVQACFVGKRDQLRGIQQ
ncbi:iron-containing alcohol dehydrogenase [Caballeronia udeis]